MLSCYSCSDSVYCYHSKGRRLKEQFGISSKVNLTGVLQVQSQNHGRLLLRTPSCNDRMFPNLSGPETVTLTSHLLSHLLVLTRGDLEQIVLPLPLLPGARGQNQLVKEIVLRGLASQRSQRTSHLSNLLDGLVSKLSNRGGTW